MRLVAAPQLGLGMVETGGQEWRPLRLSIEIRTEETRAKSNEKNELTLMMSE